MKISELIAPAGSLESLETALLYGADAIYAGVPNFGLRAKSLLTPEELIYGSEIIHKQNKKLYLTLNSFFKNSDFDNLDKLCNIIKAINADALIISDLAVFTEMKKNFPNIEFHVSTQANICSYKAVNSWANLGADLCVLARELSFTEIKEIREKCPNIKLETFIHGAMCMSYSGRCLLSNFLTGRAANKGDCAHSCRWKYKVYLEEEKRPNEFFELIEDDKGSYILNSKDLCLMSKINKLLEIGIDSLKIEGRNKTQYYAAIVVRAYKQAMKDYYKNSENFNYKLYTEELLTVANRGYTEGFFEGNLSEKAHNYETTASNSKFEWAAYIEDLKEDYFVLRIKNKIQIGDVFEFISPIWGQDKKVKINNLIDNKTSLKKDVVHGSENTEIRFYFKDFLEQNNNLTLEELKKNFPKYTVIRKEKSF